MLQVLFMFQFAVYVTHVTSFQLFPSVLWCCCLVLGRVSSL